MSESAFNPSIALAHWSADRETGARAMLRRSAGRDFNDTPGIWPLVLPYADRPYAQRALATALSMWAIHQQSSSTNPHSAGGAHLGQALLQLRGRATSPDGVDRRFASLIGSESLAEVANHLRGLVTLLRGHSISLDYSRLAFELRRFELESRSVALSWARDYYALPFEAKTATVSTAAEPTL